jgi:ComF family protein
VTTPRAVPLLRTILDAILPPRCIVTGRPVDAPGTLSPEAWAAVTFITPPMCTVCGDMFGFGAEPGLGNDGACARCYAAPPPFASARAAIAYDGAGRDLVLGFKCADKTHAGPAFVPWLRRAGARALEDADVLVPVPLHPRRLLARRYNQAAVLSAALAAATGVAHAPLALMRTRATARQGHKNAAERAANVEGAFAVSAARVGEVAGRVCVLVDDVYTTGATARACTRALLAAGAARVHVLTLARVVRV